MVFNATLTATHYISDKKNNSFEQKRRWQLKPALFLSLFDLSLFDLSWFDVRSQHNDCAKTGSHNGTRKLFLFMIEPNRDEDRPSWHRCRARSTINLLILMQCGHGTRIAFQQLARNCTTSEAPRCGGHGSAKCNSRNTFHANT
jgi:hypothetical protein